MYAIKITTTNGDTMYRQSYGTLVADKSKARFIVDVPPNISSFRESILNEHKQWEKVSFEEVTEAELESWGNVLLFKINNNTMATEQQYKEQTDKCAQIFHKKNQDYGDSYKAFRPHALFSQCLNKAQIARKIQEGATSNAEETQQDCFTAIYNYSLMYFINQEGKTYLEAQEVCFEVMKDKNKLYGDRWKKMWVEDITDFIHVKLKRVETLLAKKENVAQEYIDIANYAIFSLILLSHVPKET